MSNKFSRDSVSGAIINTDEAGYNAAKLRKSSLKKRRIIEEENVSLQQKLQQKVKELELRIERLEKLINY